MNRPDYLRETPRWDRSAAGMRWTTYRTLQVVDLFCGRGGVGWAIHETPAPIEPHMHAGFDIEDYSETYPGQFGQLDLLDDPDRQDLADAAGQWFPRGPGSLRVTNAEAEGPDLPPRDGFTADVVWASFPCTAYSSLSPTYYGSREAALEQNPRITDEFREFLLSIAPNYVIENVPMATQIGDLDANCRVNGLAFGKPYDLERHFETTFPCPDAYEDGNPEVTIDTRHDQSVKDLAEAKGVPAEWGTQAVRSAIPFEYTYWVLHHCPSVPAPMPKRNSRPLAPQMQTALGVVEG